MIKTVGRNGSAKVKFTLDPAVGASSAAICGEWNGWSADADVMKRDPAGGFGATVELQVGRAYRFRYLLDGQRWENDWNADAYPPNDFGGDDSLINLTDGQQKPGRKKTAKATASAEGLGSSAEDAAIALASVPKRAATKRSKADC